MTTTDGMLVHVDIGRLDALLNLVGELAVARSALVEHARRARTLLGLSPAVMGLVASTERFEAVVKELQARVLATRLVPIGRLFSRFERLVDTYCRDTSKEARLVIRGGATEVDKRTSDELMEPLVHLLRNALDHGIETPEQRRRAGKNPVGTIVLEATHEGSRLVVVVKDDGSGVNLQEVGRIAVERGLVAADALSSLSAEQKLQLLFRAGFSTARRVTDISGRGVGLDSAWHRVRAAGGTLTMSSDQGRGSEVRIELPLTTAIVGLLEVKLRDERYGLPLEHVRETVRISRSAVDGKGTKEVHHLRGRAVRVIDLAAVFSCERNEFSDQAFGVVVALASGEEVALLVDDVGERHEMVIKALGWPLQRVAGLMGAAVDREGDVLLVLDVPEIGRNLGRGVHEDADV